LKSSCIAAIAVAAVAVTLVKAEDITLWTLNFDNNAANVALKKVASDFEAANPGTHIEIAQRAVDEHKTVPLTLGIRPEDISLGGDEGIEAIVKVIEPTGSETHVAVEVEGKELTWVVRERVSLVPEQRVKLSFATPKVHFFDRQTQSRLDA